MRSVETLAHRIFRVALAAAALSTSLAGALPAIADGTSQPYTNGGVNLRSIIADYNRTGERFRIEGYCRSSCTMLLAIRNVCIDPNATLAFHAAIRTPTQTPTAEANNRLASFYNARLRKFVLDNHYMDSYEFHTISGAEMIHTFGYKQCS